MRFQNVTMKSHDSKRQFYLSKSLELQNLQGLAQRRKVLLKVGRMQISEEKFASERTKVKNFGLANNSLIN